MSKLDFVSVVIMSACVLHNLILTNESHMSQDDDVPDNSVTLKTADETLNLVGNMKRDLLSAML